MRKSGCADIYWNCKIVNSTKESKHIFNLFNIEFVEADINFDRIYLKKEDGIILEIDTIWDIRVGIDVAEEIKLTNK